MKVKLFCAALCLLLLAGCGVFGSFDVNASGGVTALFRPEDGLTPTGDQWDAACAVMKARLSGLGMTDYSVIAEGNSLSVSFPASPSEASDFAAFFTELGRTGRLTFRDPNGAVVLEGSQVGRATAQMDQTVTPTSYYVSLELTQAGKEAFADATARLTGQTLSIYMDEAEISAPTIQAPITDGSCVITGLESMDSAEILAYQINSGTLPFALVLEDWRIVEPK